jgi:hypothetical protein
MRRIIISKYWNKIKNKQLVVSICRVWRALSENYCKTKILHLMLALQYAILVNDFSKLLKSSKFRKKNF